MAIVVAQLSNQNPHIQFASIDVDKNPESATEAGVTSMPTFHVSILVVFQWPFCILFISFL